MPDATELVSTANLKTYLQITGSTYDTALEAIKDAVEDWVKGFVDRDLLVTAYTEYYDGDGSGLLRVRQYPITSITSIHADPARLFAAATLIPSSDLITDVDQNDNIGIIELYTYRFLRGIKNIKVIYSAGYSTVPDRLQYAVKLMCAREWTIYEKRLAGMTVQQIGEKSVTMEIDAIPKAAMDILNKYRRIDLL